MRALCLLLLAACTEGPRSGTAVGNPGNLDVVVPEEGEGVFVEEAFVHVSSVVLQPCADVAFVLQIGRVLDARAPGDGVEVPGGRYCGAVVGLEERSAGALEVAGRTAAGTTFTLAANPEPLRVLDPFEVDGDELLLVLPLADALDAAELDALGSGAAIAPGDPVATSASQAAVDASAVYEDVDANGLLSEPDRRLTSPLLDTGLGQPMAADAGTADAGCGCASGPRPGGLLAALLAWLLIGFRAGGVRWSGVRSWWWRS